MFNIFTAIKSLTLALIKGTNKVITTLYNVDSMLKQVYTAYVSNYRKIGPIVITYYGMQFYFL